jgi:hypothetical protein
VAAHAGPLAHRPSVVTRPADVVLAFRSAGAECPRRVPKPYGSAALWDLWEAYDCRVGRDPVLVLVFDTAQAIVQVKGRGVLPRRGLIDHDNLVALYDPNRLNASELRRLRMTLRTASRLTAGQMSGTA